MRECERDAYPSFKDRGSLRSIVSLHGHVPLTEINSAWVDARIQQLKRIGKIALATIQEEVCTLVRRTYEGMRKGLHDHVGSCSGQAVASDFFFPFGGWESLSVLDARSGFLSKLSVEIFEQAGAQGQDGTGCSTGSLLLAISFSIVEM